MHSEAFKSKVILAAVNGERTRAELALGQKATAQRQQMSLH